MKKKHKKCKKHACKGGGRGRFSPCGFLVKGLLLMLLWNALIPDLFGGPEIGYLQSLGIMLFTYLISGGMRHRMRSEKGEAMRMRWKSKMREKWEEMNKEEKTRFKASFRRGPVEVNVFEVEEEEEHSSAEEEDQEDKKED